MVLLNGSGRSLSGEERAKRFMLLLLGLQRLSYLAPSFVGQLGAEDAAAASALLGATICWNVGIFYDAHRRGWFPRWVAGVDVTWASVLFFAVPAGLPDGAADGPLDWSGRIGQAASAMAGAVFVGAPAFLAVGVLMAAHTVRTYGLLHGSPDLVPELITCLNGILWFAVIIGVGFRYLCRQGHRLDRESALRVAAEARNAHHRVRLAHHRALHDTALSTLTAIARGVGAASTEVRRRCASDADYIRRLLRREPDEPASSLGERLAGAIADAEALGLRVHYVHDSLPTDLPPVVVDAVGGAAREALNNVARHAGTDTAWLTVLDEGDAVFVRVVDRGRGFDPDAVPAGFGLRGSIRERMAAAGGAACLSSAVGEGTCVELRWAR
jgi:signal transduction histidine kinase